MTHFKNKFVGFIDILGFKKLVEAAEDGTGLSMTELLDIVAKLGSQSERENFQKYGPTTCPNSSFLERNLDFQLIQISDCVIMSSEISPAGIVNLVSKAWSASIGLLAKGILCRGYITQGSVYHTENQVIGSGYQNAFLKERAVTAFKKSAEETGTPFIELDPAICDYVNTHGDACVKEMFSRFVKSDGQVTAIFPFQRLSHSFSIGRDFDAAKQKASNANLRRGINDMKNRILKYVDPSNERAMSKVQHYIAALDAQLVVCDKTDEMIDKLSAPFPRQRYQ